MTFDDYKPIPGVDWATNGAVPTVKKVTIALVAFDFADQPFVITQPKKSDPFGNPQIDPVKRDDVPKFYADFYNTPNAFNKGHTINGYWMEQSGGKVGITDVKTYGPYRMPKKLYQYGLNDIGQQGKPTSATAARRTRRVTARAHRDADDRGRRLGVLLRRRHRHVRLRLADGHEDRHRDPGRDAHHGQRADHGRQRRHGCRTA